MQDDLRFQQRYHYSVPSILFPSYNLTTTSIHSKDALKRYISVPLLIIKSKSIIGKEFQKKRTQTAKAVVPKVAEMVFCIVGFAPT